MFSLFGNPTKHRDKNPDPKNSKTSFKSSCDVLLGIIQVVTFAAACFAVAKMGNEKKQFHKNQTDCENRDRNYNCDCAKPIENSETPSKHTFSGILQLMVSLTTVAASIATCITVWEMRNERNQLYKPQMIFESTHYSDDYLKSIFPVRNSGNLVSLLNDDEFYPPLQTTIYNIGSGPALEIEVEFILVLDDYNKYTEKIGKYYSDGTIVATDYGFKVYYNNKEYKHYIDKRDFTIRKPFLLSGESMDIEIPKEFCELLYYTIYCTFGDYVEDRSFKSTIYLQVSFLDLQGIRYCMDYELAIEMVASASKEGHEYFQVDYNIEQS